MNYIDESTFLQLIEALADHRRIVKQVAERAGILLTYDEISRIEAGTNLEFAARSQARKSGIVAFGSLKK